MPAMRRLFALLLVLLVPLQLAFAGAAGYCGLEGDCSAASHFGHHVHTEADAPDDGGGERGYGECGICHLGCAKLAQSAVGLPAPTPLRIPLALSSPSAPDHPQPPLDRPPRVALA